MSVTNANFGARHFFCYLRRRDVWKIETKSRHSLPNSFLFTNAVNRGARIVEHLQHLKRKHLFVLPNSRHCAREIRSTRCSIAFASEPFAEFRKISDRSIHAGYIFIYKGSCLDFHWRFIRNKIFAKRWQCLQQFEASPQKSHMRSE